MAKRVYGDDWAVLEETARGTDRDSDGSSHGAGGGGVSGAGKLVSTEARAGAAAGGYTTGKHAPLQPSADDSATDAVVMPAGTVVGTGVGVDSSKADTGHGLGPVVQRRGGATQQRGAGLVVAPVLHSLSGGSRVGASPSSATVTPSLVAASLPLLGNRSGVQRIMSGVGSAGDTGAGDTGAGAGASQGARSSAWLEPLGQQHDEGSAMASGTL